MIHSRRLNNKDDSTTGVLAAGIALMLCCAAQVEEEPKMSVDLVNPKATKETRALYLSLSQMAKTRNLFGHQNSTLYEVGSEGFWGELQTPRAAEQGRDAWTVRV